MINIDPSVKINPEWIEARLSEHLPITSRFNIPATERQVADLLMGAVMSQVRRRRMSFVDNESLRNQIRQMAEWLTTDDCKCCCMLCGMYGNGKSTLVKALQQLVNYLDIKDENDGQRWGFRILDAKEIAWMCREDRKAWNELRHVKMLAIDDLGTEPVEVMDYGNRQNPVIDLLYKRYDS
ncbi:MAG: hypothetical protein K2O88_05215, partial [Paramuribaculum sp.]|nr:hypothetical protein [Paramuribaculum sp.]